ncbi:MAG: TatD family hydrolase [Saprospiraceae bacterium]|nr:TatD family hydrolase [Saprospiraceae bacterium]
MIDTHCHVYAENLSSDRRAVMKRAMDSGVTAIMMPNIDRDSIEAMMAVEHEFPFCLSMMGLHPCSVDGNHQEELKLVAEWFAKRSFHGVGETGIDLYWDKTWVEEQKIAFDFQIGLAESYDVPVVIHSRDSLDMTIKMIADRQYGNLKGVFHCFTGTVEQARQIIDLGFYLGIGGVLTYKNSTLPEVVKAIGPEWLVLETDSPYLPPVPMRGKTNEPSYLHYILEKLAEVLDLEATEVARLTSANAEKLFGLTPKDTDI